MAESLLHYVNRLRYPYSDVVVNEKHYRVGAAPGAPGARHTIICVSHTDRDPLLQQLRDAVHSSFGSHGAATRGSERIPFNADALELYAAISKSIGDEYYEVADANPDPRWEPEEVLGKWLLLIENGVRGGTIDEGYPEAARSEARGWVDRIEGLFNPPRKLELTVVRQVTEHRKRAVQTYTRGTQIEEIQVTREVRIPAPCPECEERYAYDAGTGNRRFALVLEYWELGAETFGKLRATCGACGYEWHGQDAARNLMVLIDEKDRELQELEAARQLLDTPDAHDYVHPVAAAG